MIEGKVEGRTPMRRIHQIKTVSGYPPAKKPHSIGRNPRALERVCRQRQLRGRQTSVFGRWTREEEYVCICTYTLRHTYDIIARENPPSLANVQKDKSAFGVIKRKIKWTTRILRALAQRSSRKPNVWV